MLRTVRQQKQTARNNRTVHRQRKAEHRQRTLWDSRLDHLLCAHFATSFPVPNELLLTFFARLGGTRSHRNFRLRPHQCPVWSLNRHACHSQGCATQQARACGFFFNRTLCCTRTHAHSSLTWFETVGCTHSPLRILRPAGRDLEHHTQVGIRVDSCHSPSTSASAHEVVHPHPYPRPHTWKQFTSFINISNLSLVRCLVPKSEEFVSEGIFSTVSMLTRTAS